MSCVRRRLSVSMYSPYSRALSMPPKRPRRRNSPKTWIEASGVRSSCETLETNSFFICDSFISREAKRRASMRPQRSTAASADDSPRLRAKLRCASSAAVACRVASATFQSVNTKPNGRRASVRQESLSEKGAVA